MTAGGLFGVALMIGFAAIGYFMRIFGFSFAPFIIAFVLGRQYELALAQSLIITNEDPMELLKHPVAVIFLILAVFCVYWLGIRKASRINVSIQAGSK